MNGNSVTEDELKAAAKGKRVTLEDVNNYIEGEYYFTAMDGAHFAADRGHHVFPNSPPHTEQLSLLTFCVLVLKNGFSVTGESACADPTNFNEEIGRRLARAAAVNKIWPLLGFQLRSELYEASKPNPQTTFVDRMAKELGELSDRVFLARRFTKTEQFKTLSEKEQSLHNDQVAAMETYRAVLHERVVHYDNKV